MRRSRFLQVGALVLVGVIPGACSDGTGLGDPEQIDVTMQQAGVGAAQMVAGWSASIQGAEVTSISAADVSSLEVTVTEIQFLPSSSPPDEADDGAWVTLDLGASVVIDLASLPTEGESPLVIASGSVPAGSYRSVRLFASSATVVFSAPIDLGVAFNFEARVEYAVEIPSGAQTGIKSDADFTVEEGAEGETNDVHLLFDPSATYLNVSGTGNGVVFLTPVIRERP